VRRRTLRSPRSGIIFILVAGLALIASARPAGAVFDAEAVSPAERGAATALALAPRPTRAVSVYGFKPFGLEQIDFLALSVEFPVRGGAWGVGLACQRLTALAYTEQVGAVSLVVRSGRVAVTPTVRVGTVQSRPGFSDWAVVADVAATARVTGSVEVAVAVENPFAIGLVGEGSRIPRRLRLGLGTLVSATVGWGAEVLKEPGFPLSIRSGIEWAAAKAITVRTGARTCPAEMAFGLGFRRGRVAVDLASALAFELGTTYEAGVTVTW